MAEMHSPARPAASSQKNSFTAALSNFLPRRNAPLPTTIVHASRGMPDEWRNQLRAINALQLEAVDQMETHHCQQQLDEMLPVEPTAAPLLLAQLDEMHPAEQTAAVRASPHGDADSDLDGDADNWSDSQSSGGRKGDSVGSQTDAELKRGDLSAVSARRTEMAQPKHRVVGDRHPYHEPAERNRRKDVGNFGIFVGNWGERSATSRKSADCRMLHDSQVMGSPGELIVILEANRAVADMLKQPPRHVPDEMNGPPRHNAKAPVGNMSKRDHYQHMVVMTDYPHGQILMAARKNVCLRAESIVCHAWVDGHWKKTTKKRRQQLPKPWCVSSRGNKTSGIWAGILL